MTNNSERWDSLSGTEKPSGNSGNAAENTCSTRVISRETKLLFRSKREQWEWMKQNTPDLAQLVTDTAKVFGKLQAVTVWSSRFECPKDSASSSNSGA